MLELVKLALRVTDADFEPLLEHYIRAAQEDLRSVGVTPEDADNDLFRNAVVTYCQAMFGGDGQRERLLAIYDGMKGQMQHTTGFTDWGTQAETPANDWGLS